MAKVERQVECRSGEVALHRLWAARRPLLFQEDPSSEAREDRVGVGECGGETGLEGERLRAGWRSLGIHEQLEKGNSCQVRE